MSAQSSIVELARVGPLGHDLQRRVGRAADHRHAHEVEAQFLDGGLDQASDGSGVGQTRFLEYSNPLRLPDRPRPGLNI